MHSSVLKKARLLLIALGFAALAADASHAAPADCANPVTPTAVTICSDPNLLNLHARMKALLEAALRTAADSEQANAIHADQQAWTARRKSCVGDPDCIRQAYEDRIGQLETSSGTATENAPVEQGPAEQTKPEVGAPRSKTETAPAQSTVRISAPRVAAAQPVTAPSSKPTPPTPAQARNFWEAVALVSFVTVFPFLLVLSALYSIEHYDYVLVRNRTNFLYIPIFISVVAAVILPPLVVLPLAGLAYVGSINVRRTSLIFGVWATFIQFFSFIAIAVAAVFLRGIWHTVNEENRIQRHRALRRDDAWAEK